MLATAAMASNIIDSSDENEVFVYQNYQETSIEGYKFEPSKSKTTPTEQKEGKSQHKKSKVTTNVDTRARLGSLWWCTCKHCINCNFQTPKKTVFAVVNFMH